MNSVNRGYRGYLPGGVEPSQGLPARSDTFYGRLGSLAKDNNKELVPKRRISFSRSSSLRRVVVRLMFDEDAYPGGLDLDMFAMLYDSSCSFVDCIFYKHPEDASGSFSLNQKTHSLFIDLETVPDSCHTIVLACAVYTTGMTISELESGLIEISEGLMGPVLFSIPLQSLEPPSSGSSTTSSSNAAGLLFFSLSEFGGKWRCRLLKTFCQAELPSLMKLAKEEAQQVEEDFALGDFQNLKTLDFAAHMAETPATALSLSGSVREGGRGSASANTNELEKLSSGAATLREGEKAEGSTGARLLALEEEQRRMSRQLTRIEEKLEELLNALKV